MAAGALCSCHRKETRAVERLAVLPFQNLSADPGLDWIGPALATMVAEQASASLHYHLYRAEDLRGARLSGAVRVVQGYYSRAGDQVSVHAVVEDLRSRRNVSALSARAGLRNVSGMSESLARSIDKRTRPFGTQNPDAIRAWGEALAAPGTGHRAEALGRAIAADPNFGAAYLDLAGLYLSGGDEARASDVLKRADDRLSQFTDLERARLEFLEGGVRHNDAQRRLALTALSRLVTTDAQSLRTLANLEVNARRFPSAVELLKSAVAIEPENPALLNELGYAESYRGNLAGARDALDRYRAVQPAQPNPLDSLGEVHFFGGRFAEAEKYFLEGNRLDPSFQGGVELLKAAQSRFLQGDRNGADQLYGAFDELRRKGRDPAADVRKAEWLYITGRRQEAMAQLDAAAKNSNTEVVAYALCHAALFALASGNTAQAAELSARAMQLARNPALQRLAVLFRAIAMPATGAPPESAPSDLVRGYRALFAKDAAQAVAVFRPLYEKSSPAADGDVRTLYAWALSEAGQNDPARPLLERYFIPLGSADDTLLTAHAFPHFLALRNALLGSK